MLAPTLARKVQPPACIRAPSQTACRAEGLLCWRQTPSCSLTLTTEGCGGLSWRVLVHLSALCTVPYQVTRWRLVGRQHLWAKEHPEPRSCLGATGWWIPWPAHQPNTGNIEMYRIQLSNPGMNVRPLKRNLSVIKIMHKF